MMDPITRDEMFMAAAAGEYDGELPAPITRQEQYLKKIIEEIDGGGSVSPEQIDAALAEKQDALTAGDNITIATVNGVLTISADTPAPTDVQVQTAVDNYLDQNGVVFNTSAEITEVLNGN